MSDDKKPLHVVELFVENFMKISTVLIKPTGTMVEISGKNGNGKSSALDAMWTALAGASVAPVKPIKTGAEKATIRLSLGDLIVTRTFKRKAKKEDDKSPGEEITTEVRVESADGARFPKPQQILQSFYDELTLDPTEFERMDDKGKFNALKKFVPDFDFEKSAGLTLADMEKRKDINRRQAEAAAAAAQIVVAEGTPDQLVDEAALVAELEQGGAMNLEIEQRKNRREQTQARVQEIAALKISSQAEKDTVTDRARQRCAEIMAQAEADVKGIDLRLVDLDVELATLNDKIATAEPLPEPLDLAGISQKIAAARITNEAVGKKHTRATLIAKAAELDASSKELTAAMATRETQKQAAIKGAALPVPGLGFGDDVILFNGEPFAQASQADRIKTSAAIAMASNPRLRVLRIRHGNDLDEDAMQALMEMCAANNFQCWIERINATGPMGFVLEDGHLKEPDQKTLV